MRDTIHVYAVDSRRTRAGEKFDVVARPKPGERWSPMYATFDPLLASLADRARVLGVPLQIAWHQSAYGRELDAAQIAARVDTEVA